MGLLALSEPARPVGTAGSTREGRVQRLEFFAALGGVAAGRHSERLGDPVQAVTRRGSPADSLGPIWHHAIFTQSKGSLALRSAYPG
ncbi:hypothetical protein GCM10010260_78440 [Streptomyces filipinensis]|uniref:Uncharacterized protein n=1 Tax=Streptomyces filipinensis TaxID=66887 RepID=A0A918IM00_9ACTN|nr:hypothetical protein GCM10010260_78440 [Streptomyces filipinensis]